MSSIWKKLKGEASKSEDTKNSVCLKHVFVNVADEEAFLNFDGNSKYDPLTVKTQIIKSLKSTLQDSPALPYFLEFLQSQDAEQYAHCWMECEKFRTLAQSLIFNCLNKNKEETSITTSSESQTSNISSVSKVHSGNLNEKNDSKSILPDLVSNIPKDAPVTPLPSPDGELQTPQQTTFNNSIEKDNNETTVAQSTPDLSSNDKNGNENLFKDPSVQRLLSLSSEIIKSYLNNESPKFIPLDSNQPYESGCTTVEECANTFCHLQQEIYQRLEQQYFPKFLESEYFLKYEVDVFTSQSVTFQDLISSDSAMPYLMLYMEQEGGQPLMDFWISAYNFKEHLMRSQQDKNYDSEEAQTDAMILYDKYFSLQATHSLGFSDKTRFLVESNICQDDGPSAECFDTPLRIILHIIQRDYLAGYMSSTLHIKYVSELVNNLKMNTLARKKRSGSGSTCSSEQNVSVSSSSQRGGTISRSNTLLAMDSYASTSPASNKSDLTKKSSKSFDESSMRIDAAQIFDPDSLWRRKNFTKLSCGFVDEFGRFESDLQPEPDKKSASKFSQTLKKFAKIEENKDKEEMAYKVAEMIIKDVTNVTLGRHHKSLSMNFPLREEEVESSTTTTSRLARSNSEIFQPKVSAQQSSVDKTSLSNFNFASGGSYG